MCCTSTIKYNTIPLKSATIQDKVTFFDYYNQRTFNPNSLINARCNKFEIIVPKKSSHISKYARRPKDYYKIFTSQ